MEEMSHVSGMISCAVLGQVKYQDVLDIRKDIEPTPGRYGESVPGTLITGDF